MRGRAHSQAARCSRRICSKKEKEAKKKRTISILVQPVLSFPVSIYLVPSTLSISLSHHRPLVYSPSFSSLFISPLSFLSVLPCSLGLHHTSIFVPQLFRSRSNSVLVARFVSFPPLFVLRMPSSLLVLSFSRLYIKHRFVLVSQSHSLDSRTNTLARSVHYSLFSLSVVPFASLAPAGRNTSHPSRLLCYFSPTSVYGRYARAAIAGFRRQKNRRTEREVEAGRWDGERSNVERGKSRSAILCDASLR